MPFTKVKRKGRTMYRGPSGRVFNKKQVRRYYARGGTFDAICNCGTTHGSGLYCDASTITKSDPTGTLSLRRAFARELDRRWRMVKIAVNAAVRDQDVFALSPASIMSAQVISTEGGRLKAFQSWFDAILGMYVYGQDRGVWAGQYIAPAYKRGVDRALRLLNAPSQVNQLQGRDHLLTSAAVSEIQGVMEAVSQQSVRSVNTALISGAPPREAARAINQVIDEVGSFRGRAVASVTIVHAHATGTLDTFESLGVQRVGLEPESHHGLGDSLTHDAPRRKKAPTARQQRIFTRREQKLSRLGRVNVETAGDEKVCPVCEDIAADGPYTIDAARGLIPAHPSCRCAFVPADEGDTEDALVNWLEDYNKKHEPAGAAGGKGGQFAPSNSSSATTSKEGDDDDEEDDDEEDKPEVKKPEEKKAAEEKKPERKSPEQKKAKEDNPDAEDPSSEDDPEEEGKSKEPFVWRPQQAERAPAKKEKDDPEEEDKPEKKKAKAAKSKQKAASKASNNKKRGSGRKASSGKKGSGSGEGSKGKASSGKRYTSSTGTAPKSAKAPSASSKKSSPRKASAAKKAKKARKPYRYSESLKSIAELRKRLRRRRETD